MLPFMQVWTGGLCVGSQEISRCSYCYRAHLDASGVPRGCNTSTQHQVYAQALVSSVDGVHRPPAIPGISPKAEDVELEIDGSGGRREGN